MSGSTARPKKNLIGYERWYNTVSILDPELSTTIKTFTGTVAGVVSASWSSDDNHFIIASQDELQIWDLSTSHPLYINTQHIGSYTSGVLPSPDGAYLAVLSRNIINRYSQICDSVRVWKTASSKPAISLTINIWARINWISNTNLLALYEPYTIEQPCQREPQLRILDTSTNHVVTITRTQLTYLKYIVNIWFRISNP